MYLAIFIITFSILYFLIPLILNETIDVIIKAPEITKSFNLDLITGGYFGSGSTLGNLSKTVSLSDIILQLQTLVSNLSGSVVSILSKVFGGALSFILVIVISFYLAVQEKGIHNFLKVVTPFKHENILLIYGIGRKKDREMDARSNNTRFDSWDTCIFGIDYFRNRKRSFVVSFGGII